MEWVQAITVIGVNITTLVPLNLMIIRRLNKLHNDIKSLSSIMDSHAQRMDSKMDSHAQRMDQMYTMFVDLLKKNRERK